MPRKKRTGVRFVPGESATVSRQIDSLSPEERERDAGRMAVEPRARLYHGESATVSRQICSLPPEERERDAGRMAVEPRARLYHGESATVSRQIDSLSPEERERNAGRMAVEPRARLYHGKSATVSRQISSLSPEERERDAGRMAVEPRARLYHGEKCYGFAANRFTFPGRTGEGCRQNGRRAESAIPPPSESATVSRKIGSLSPKKTDVRLPNQYDREHSFVFHVAGLELFMKTAGATANRQIHTKHCKSMYHTDRS